MAILESASARKYLLQPEAFEPAPIAPNERKKKFTIIQGIAAPINFVTPSKDASNVRENISSARFIAIVATIVTINLLGILAINTKLDQDAFTLAHLKAQRNIAMDQRDAIMRVVDSENSPSYIAKKAKTLGMAPNATLNYLPINRSTNNLTFTDGSYSVYPGK